MADNGHQGGQDRAHGRETETTHDHPHRLGYT